MNDTAEMQANKDFGGMDQTAKGHKADEMRNITEAASNAGGGTYRIPIDHAMELVVKDAEKDPSHLIPALPASTKPTIEPHFGRPQPIGGAAPTGAVPEGVAPATGAPAQQGSGAAPAGGTQGGAAGSGATMAPTGGNPAGAAGTSAPQTPTGQGPGAAGASPGSAAAQPTRAGSGAH
jgi:hypothetical protein